MDFYRILLVHGLFQNSSDMKFIENHLTSAGFRVDSLNLPLTFDNLSVSEQIIKDKIKKIRETKTQDYQEVILVGYGIGGVLVRKVIDDNNLGDTFLKIILIASPTKTPKILKKLKVGVKILSWIFKPLKIYFNDSIENLDSLSGKDVGIICGTEPKNKLFKLWLGEYNDGIYDRSEVTFDESKEFEILSIPFSHHEVCKKKGTAEYILDFIETGKFIR